MADGERKTTVSVNISELLKSTSAQRTAYLIVMDGQAVGKMYKVTGSRLLVGRAPDVDILIDDNSVSRNHAELVTEGDRIFIRDLGSTNGVIVNGARVESHTLKDGDRVQIGSGTILKFSYQDELEENFQRQLYESATRDGLTGAFNKKFFLSQLEIEFSYCFRHSKPFSLVLFDMDHFKQVNDTYGHPAGDFVLQETATLVQQAIRTEDIFCRYGGEEFGVLLRGTDADRAFLVAERIRRDVESHPYSYQGASVPVTVSIGVSTLTPGSGTTTSNALVAEADEYLYKAKQGGRNRTESALIQR